MCVHAPSIGLSGVPLGELRVASSDSDRAGQSWNIGNILVAALLLNGGGLDIGGTLGDQDPALP